MTSVAVVACIYGDQYDRFVDDWYDSILALDRPADEVLLHRGERWPGEKYPQPRLQNEAAEQIQADWIWQLNVDDIALPTALNGIDTVASDVWLMGYRTEDGDQYIPKALPNDEYLDLDTNPYPGMSAYRRGTFEWVNGYPLIAHEDWGLWRRFAAAGCTFQSSGRVHCTYRWHPQQRSQTELLTGNPARMMRELLADA